MGRIGPVGRLGPTRIEAIRTTDATPASPEAPPSRALTIIEGGRRDLPPPLPWAEAGFVAQLIVGADPTLTASRLVRSWQAAARYAETARRLAEKSGVSKGTSPFRGCRAAPCDTAVPTPARG